MPFTQDETMLIEMLGPDHPAVQALQSQSAQAGAPWMDWPAAMGQYSPPTGSAPAPATPGGPPPAAPGQPQIKMPLTGPVPWPQAGGPALQAPRAPYSDITPGGNAMGLGGKPGFDLGDVGDMRTDGPLWTPPEPRTRQDFAARRRDPNRPPEDPTTMVPNMAQPRQDFAARRRTEPEQEAPPWEGIPWPQDAPERPTPYADLSALPDEAPGKTVEQERSAPLGYDRDKLVRQKMFASGIKDFSEGFGGAKTAGHVLLGQPSGYVAESARGREERAALQLQPENDPTSEYSKSNQRTAEKMLGLPEGDLAGSSASAIQSALPMMQRFVIRDLEQFRKTESSFLSKLNNFRSQVVASPLLRGVKEKMAQIKVARSMLEEGKPPIETRGAMISVARASGEKGPLSDQDIKTWESYPGLQGIKQRVGKFWTSEWDEEVKQSLRQALDDIEEVALQQAQYEGPALAESFWRQLESERQFITENAARVGREAKIPSREDIDAIVNEVLGIAGPKANTGFLEFTDPETGEVLPLTQEEVDQFNRQYNSGQQ